MRALLFVVLLAPFLSLAACSNLPPPQRADVQPMVHDGHAVKGVKRAIVLVPGALASVELFAPVMEWDIPDSTVIAYRFPGVDGMELDHRIDIVDSGAMIARALNALEVEEVYLIGYSTGGPIALETARRLDTDKVQMALISSASDSPAASLASIRGAVDIVKAMFRSKQQGIDEAMVENYRTLLYGRDHFSKDDLAEQSRQMATVKRGQIVKPPNKMTMAHMADLLTWQFEDPASVYDDRIGFFHGAEDSVFSERLTRRYARRLQAEAFHSYEGQGHLLFVTEPHLFDDIRAFFGLGTQG